MKQATGELNLTLVTMSIIAAVLLAISIMIPMIVGNANNTWSDRRGNTNVNFGMTDGDLP